MDSPEVRQARAVRDLLLGALLFGVGVVYSVTASDAGFVVPAEVAWAAVAGSILLVRGAWRLVTPARTAQLVSGDVALGAPPVERWIPRSFRWFVAIRYLMAALPRRPSEPLVGFTLVCILLGSFGVFYELWVPLAPPFVFGGPPISPTFYVLAALVAGLVLSHLALAAMAVGASRGGRTLRVALWLATLGALAAVSLIGIYAVIRQAPDPEQVMGTWMPVAYGVAGLGLLSPGLLLRGVPERVVRVAMLVALAGLGCLAFVGYGALGSELSEARVVSELSAGSYGRMGLALVGALALCVGLVFTGIRIRGAEDYERRAGRWEALALAGLALIALAVLLHVSQLLDQLGEPTLRMLGIEAGDEFRPLWVPGLQRGAIILGSIGFALAIIRYYFSFFTTVSIGGVMVGTMALIMVLSVMGGFENDLRQKILGSNAHILITKAEGDFVEYREIGAKVGKVERVEAYGPFIVSEVVIAARQNYANVLIKGVDPLRVGEVTQLADDIEQDYDRPLERLYPLADDGGVRGPPPDAGPRPTAPIDAGPRSDAMDPAPDGFDVPDFDPVDLSGGWTTAGDAGPEPSGQAGARDPDDLDPMPDDMAVPDDGAPMDLSGGLSADQVRAQQMAALDAGVPGDGGIEDELEPAEGLDTRVDEFVTAEELGLGKMPDLGVSPEIAELPGVLVGRELVKQLSNYVGQEVTVVSPLGQDTPLGPVPRTKRYRVAGTFYTGMYEYDLKYVYVELSTLQDFLDIGDEVNGIEIRIDDPNQTESVMEELARVLGPNYRIQDWRALNKSLFSALKLEKIAMFIVLAIIILVASFSIVGNLVMIVIEKAREIAVIKTLGATNRTVTDIFIGQGFVIGLTGMLTGVSLGLYHTLVTLEGFPLDPNVYYIDQLPINLEPLSVVYVGLASIVISSLATMYPAGLAASQRPVEGLARE